MRGSEEEDSQARGRFVLAPAGVASMWLSRKITTSPVARQAPSMRATYDIQYDTTQYNIT